MTRPSTRLGGRWSRLSCAHRRRLDRLLLPQRDAAPLRTVAAAGRLPTAQVRSVGRGEEHADSPVGRRQGRARLRRRSVVPDCRTSARGVRTGPAASQRGGRAPAAVRRRQLRRDLLDGYDRALCRVGGGARRDDPRPATGRPHRARRAEPVRPVRPADTRGRLVPIRLVCVRVREVVLTPPATRDASAVGVEVVAETGILFMPGWLRMLDLALHCWCRPLGWVTRPAVAGCAWLDRHVPLVRRHGYLLASVGVKPERSIHDGR